MAADPDTQARTPAVREALTVVEMGTRAATSYQRPDLARRLASTRARLVDPSVHVFVVGEYKKGKSSLVNALLDTQVCPVDDDIATAVPTAVRYAEHESAAILYRPAAGDPEAESPAPVRAPIPLARLADHITEGSGSPDLSDGSPRARGHGPDVAEADDAPVAPDDRPVHAVEVGLPRPLLAGGLVVVDTPGVGGLGSPQAATTLGALPMADALVMVSDAGQELTAPELEFLHAARRMCPTVLCVLTKVDFHPHWHTIRDLNAGHLARHGIEAPIVCTAAPLRVAARRTGDRALDDESGFPELEAHLRDGIVADAEHVAVRAASDDVAEVAGQLATQFQRERAALTAADGREAVAHLGEIQARAARLGSSVARWQQTLADGIADLTADLDHELRTRLRVAAKEADEAVDAADPADMWDEFEPWLRRRVSQDVVATYAALHRRSRQLAARVGEHFEEAGRAVAIRPDVFDPSRLVGEVEADTDIDTFTLGRGEAIITGVRGGYMGMLMFGMLGSMLAGLSMLNPATAVIGMAMGRKSLRQEKDRRLAQRRNSAKVAHRKYADEVAFVVMKDARDTLRRVQRQLRDHYAARAEELQRTTNEALAAARQAAAADASTRQRRLRDVDAELERIAGLRRKALDLSPHLAGSTRA